MLKFKYCTVSDFVIKVEIVHDQTLCAVLFPISLFVLIYCATVDSVPYTRVQYQQLPQYIKFAAVLEDRIHYSTVLYSE